MKGNATTGTITGIDGEFALSVPSDAILSISYIGFKSQEVSVSGKTSFKIILLEDTETLDEVVVVGYGVQKKSVVTASIAKVSSEDLAGKTRLRADDALKGMAGRCQCHFFFRPAGGKVYDSYPWYRYDQCFRASLCH